jgi:hypothetical protein
VGAAAGAPRVGGGGGGWGGGGNDFQYLTFIRIYLFIYLYFLLFGLFFFQEGFQISDIIHPLPPPRLNSRTTLARSASASPPSIIRISSARCATRPLPRFAALSRGFFFYSNFF